MDFLHRNANNQPQTAHKDGVAAINSVNTNRFRQAIDGEPRWLRFTFVVLLFSLTILAIAIALLLYFGKTKEGNYINDKKVQAVFLTNGQVYFGKVASVSDQYIDLRGIYYLNTQQQQQTDANKTAEAPTNFSLVKLGCELHGPSDQMIINRAQVTFWENLTDNGKVAKAIDQWKSQNPNGQECKTTTDSTQQSPGAATGTSTGTGAATGTTKKP
jgi:hypothetical protein